MSNGCPFMHRKVRSARLSGSPQTGQANTEVKVVVVTVRQFSHTPAPRRTPRMPTTFASKRVAVASSRHRPHHGTGAAHEGACAGRGRVPGLAASAVPVRE